MYWWASGFGRKLTKFVYVEMVFRQNTRRASVVPTLRFGRSVVASLAAVVVVASFSNPSWPREGFRGHRWDAKENSFFDTVLRWNGDIFWQPASQTGDVITRFGDEARAVFGP